MKKLLLKIAMVLMAWPMYGQIIEECPDQGTVVLSSLCADACVVCDIDGYSGTNASLVPGEAPPGFCAGSLHNTQWVGFVAGSEDITLEIDVFDCAFDYDNNGIFEGLQIGIYQTTDCSNFVSAFNCDDQVFDNTTGVFTNTNPLTIGGIYFLVLDGAFGDICSFTVRVTEGSTTAPEVEQVMPNIVAEQQICPGGLLDVMVDPPVYGAGAYYWTLDGEAAGTDLSSEIQFPSELGFYELCVDPYNPCSDGIQSCMMVEVVPAVVEPITESICEGAAFELGGMEYTEADVYDIYIPVADGCDEYYELTLELIPPVETFLEEEICVNNFFEVGEQNFSEPGEYSVLLVSESTGCDSIVYLDLSVIGTAVITQLEETICYGDEYLIGGDTLTEAGNYFYDFIDVVGCDSMVDLTLDVLPASEGMVEATICTGETYPFNGVDYSLAGTYTAGILLPTGCDSLAVLNLMVLPNDTTNLSEQICAGQSYTVGMETYSTAGTFETSFPAANGCDSIVILELELIEPIFTIDSISICQGDSYTFEGDTYDEPGSYDYPYVLPNGCDSIYRLVLDVLAPLTQTLNATICVDEVFSLGGETFDSTGTYMIRTPAPNGCDSLYTLQLIVLDTLFGNENITLCAEDTYTIADSTLSASGLYDFVLQSQDGCDSMVTINLQIADPIISNLDTSICNGATFSVGNELFDSTGNYTRILTASNGCDSTVNLMLNVEPTPTSTTMLDICAGGSINFNGFTYSNSGTYTDTLSTALGCDSIDQLVLTLIPNVTHTITPSICAGGSYPIADTTLSEAGTYSFVFPSSTGCDSVLTLILSVEDTIVQPLDITICEGESYTVGNNNYEETGFYENLLSTPEGCDSIVQLALTVNPSVFTALTERICSGESYEVGAESYSTEGLFTTTLTSVNSGCDSIVTLELSVITIPDTEIAASICADESYTVDGIDYDTSGVYNIPLLSADGCDSTLILDLTVIDVYETNLSVSLCPGESYAVGDSIYTLSGNYQNELAAIDGCDSIVSLDLLVYPVPDTLLTQEICAGDSFSIAGVTYNSTGVYQQTIPSVVTGCDSTIILDLTVNEWVDISLSEEICIGDSITIGTNSYANSGIYLDTLTTVIGCDSIIHLDLTVLAVDETFLEETICANETFTVGTETYNTTGSFTTILPSISSGCDSIVYLDLVVNQLASTQLNEQICSGESFELGGDSYTVAGTYQVNLSTTDGCDSTVILNLSVAPCNLTFISELTDNLCNGDSAGIITFGITAGTPPYSYSWQGNENGLNGTGNIAANDELESIVNLPADSYTINVTDANGVTAVLSASVAEPLPMQLELAVSNYGGGFQLSCAGASDGNILANVTGGTPPYSYNWNNGMSGAGLDNLPEGTYELFVTDANNCNTVATTVLAAPNLIIAELEVTPPNCVDATGSLAVRDAAGGTEPYLYALDGGSYSPASSFTGITIGTHIVSIQDANGCSRELETVMEPAPELTVHLGEDLEIAFGDSLRLSATPSNPVVSYQWSGGAISNCDTCANPLIEPKETTSYAVLVSDENGCTAEDVITVFVRKQQEVFIPTAFSPNGDGFNDRFLIYGGEQLAGIGFLRIFNRWGAMIYEAEGLLPSEETRGWDGRLRGQLLPAGVYVYVTEVRFLDGTSEVFKGEVMLLR